MALLSAHATTIQPQVNWPKPVAAVNFYTGTFEAPAVTSPAVELFRSQSGSLTGWTFNAGTTLTVAGNNAPSSPANSTSMLRADQNEALAYRTVTTTVGLTYTVSAKFNGRVSPAGINAKVGVTGLSAGSVVALTDAVTWFTATYSFVATATSHQVYLSADATTGSTTNVVFDDVLITQDFYIVYDGLDGWGLGASTSLSRSTGPTPHGGVAVLQASRPSGTTALSASRAFSALTPGRSYTARAWAACAPLSSGTKTSFLSVTGLSSGATVSTTDNPAWQEVTYTFLATSTSHVLVLNHTNTTSGAYIAYWDDITLTEDARTVSTLVDPLNVIDGAVTMDDTRVPYIQVRASVSVPPAAQRAVIDPRNDIRATLTLTQTFEDWNAFGYRAPITRTFNLSIRDFTPDVNKGTVDLILYSDEAALLNFGLVASAPERTYGLSVKDAVTYALAKIGATLAAGASDATLTSKALEPVITNMIPNPSVETNTTGYFANAGVTLTRQLHSAFGGGIPDIATESLYFLRHTYGSVQNSSGPYFNVGVTVVPGKTYTWSAWVRCSKVQAFTPAVQFSTGSGPANPIGDRVILAPNVWTRVSLTFTVGGTWTNAAPYFYSAAGTSYSAWASGDTVDMDGLIMVEGSTALDYFDGSSNPGLYAFAWTGTAHASTSTKTNLPNTDSTIWQPGQTAGNFLAPLLQIGGLRLYCDETRAWRLEPAGTTRDGLVLIGTAQNVTQAQDSISLTDTDDGYPLWYTGVVIAYTGNVNATTGQKFTTYDIAGTGTRVLNLTYDRPQPGPGAAAYVLARAAGRGRAFALEAMSDYTVTPGQALAATLPDVPLQTGYVSAVTWGLPANRMTIKSRALIDTPANSWVLATGTWAAQTKTWATYP